MQKNIEKAYFWPKWFIKSLSLSEQKSIPKKIINKLCYANLCLWRALNLYDDFLDGEGLPKNLPTANKYYRQFLKIYYQLKLSPGFYKIFEKIIDDLDYANRLEVSTKKLQIKNERVYLPPHLPYFSNLIDLSRKSLALSLWSIAIFDIIDSPKKSQNKQVALNFFRYALAAKQLSDDSCDWLDDLLAGVITPANILILRAAKKNKITLNYKKNPKIFYILFINEAAMKIATDIADLCLRAKQEGIKIGANKTSPLIRNLISPMEKKVKEARIAYTNFIDTYK